jgi:hypothetical protein
MALDMQRLEMVNRISGLLECSIFYGEVENCSGRIILGDIKTANKTTTLTYLSGVGS